MYYQLSVALMALLELYALKTILLLLGTPTSTAVQLLGWLMSAYLFTAGALITFVLVGRMLFPQPYLPHNRLMHVG